MEFLEDGRLELYNLREDVGETTNRAELLPDKARKLQERLAAWRTSVRAAMPAANEPSRGPEGLGSRRHERSSGQ
jgi:phage shock protein A